jgi:DNA-binding IclR family transcriptional regulator
LYFTDWNYYSEQRNEEASGVTVELVAKTFQVLEALAGEAKALPLAEVARRAGLPKPTAHRILRTLAELGYAAQRSEDGFYQVTARLANLGRGGERQDLTLRMLPHVERLHRRFNETVNLGILDGTNVRYLHVLETTRSLRLMVRPDALDPFYSTALGRAIAAFLPEDERARLVASASLKPVTPRTVRTRTALERSLMVARERGWAEDDEENDEGVVCFGTPVLEGDRPVAAVSVSLPKVRLDAERKKELVCALKPIRL